jgi:hypothetical protein
LLPTIVSAMRPYTFDPETETKSGGRLGMAAYWRDGRTVLAAHRDARRIHIGTALLERVLQEVAPVMWVGQTNTAGQMLCLKSGLLVTSMNSRGALRYSNRLDNEEGE